MTNTVQGEAESCIWHDSTPSAVFFCSYIMSKHALTNLLFCVGGLSVLFSSDGLAVRCFFRKVYLVLLLNVP